MKRKASGLHISEKDIPAFKDRFIELVSEGLSARKACETKQVPTFMTISKWLREDNEFRDQYRLANELRAQKIDDDIDDALEEMRSGDLDAQQARVVIDTYKWRAAKFYPRLYGDNQKVEHEHKVVSYIDELKLAAAQIEQQKLQAKTIDVEAVEVEEN